MVRDAKDKLKNYLWLF